MDPTDPDPQHCSTILLPLENKGQQAKVYIFAGPDCLGAGIFTWSGRRGGGHHVHPQELHQARLFKLSL
jgi:hypothetical protein